MSNAPIGHPGRPRDPKSKLIEQLKRNSPDVNTVDPDYEQPATPERVTRSRNSRPVALGGPTEVGTGRG